MPAHIKQRKDRGSVWYLVDGSYMRSLKTTKKGLAQYRLEEYIRGQFIKPTPTVEEYFVKWIPRKVEPLFRRSQIRDYNQHFRHYILPEFKTDRMLTINTGRLTDFQVSLLRKGLSVKTVRNIIDSSFRAMYRDARAEINELKGQDPFLDIQWPINETEPPDPFTLEEKGKVLAYVRSRHLFFYPWIFTQFATGMRPSESTALRLKDIDFEARVIYINKSRHLGVEARPKTQASRRPIVVPPEVIQMIRDIRRPGETEESYVFYNTEGNAINANEWSGKNWKEVCKKAGVRHRKFYSTRHTFITEKIEAGDIPKAVGDYCGTSLQMIQKQYCARLSLSDQTKIKPEAEKPLQTLASPTGFEPVYGNATNRNQLLSSAELEWIMAKKRA